MTRILTLLFSLMSAVSASADYPASWKRYDSDGLEAALKSSRAMVQIPICREFFKRAAKGFGDSAWERTSSLVVIREQNVMLEYYDRELGIGPDTPMKLWSGSKSITTMILGAAVQQGKISLDDPLEKYLPFDQKLSSGWKAADYSRIRIRDLMFMTSGFEWTEMDNNYDSLKKFSPLQLLYTANSADMTSYVLSRPMDPRGPGIYNYSSGDFSLLMAVLKKIYGDEYFEMPWKNLFEPLGITSAHIELDDAGVFVGGASVYMSPSDLARMGAFVLNNGMVEDRRLIPEDWISLMMTPNQGILRKDYPTERIKSVHRAMGASTYLNIRMRGVPKPYPDLPENIYVTIGLGGQAIMVFPEQKLIIVRTGSDLGFGKSVNKIGKLALQCFGGEK